MFGVFLCLYPTPSLSFCGGDKFEVASVSGTHKIMKFCGVLMVFGFGLAGFTLWCVGGCHNYYIFSSSCHLCTSISLISLFRVITDGSGN